MIPVSKPIISKNASRYLVDSLKTGWISFQGPYVSKFEKSFASFVNRKYGITTNSGTAALHIALAALKIGKEDEVIITTFTMISPVYAILYTGAKPVFVDIDKTDWNMDVSKIEEKITKKTKAIIVVHIYGNPVDMDAVFKLAKKYNLFVIEDAAESIGSEYKGKKIGSFGDISCFSFYANKIITTGEGGIAVTNNSILAKRLLLLRDMAHSPKKRFLHTEVAFTYRMTNMQAALGYSQIKNIEKIIAKKRLIANIYNTKLSDNKNLTLPFEKKGNKSNFWVYGILINKSSRISKDRLKKKLFEKGIETRDFFIPMHKQPVLKKLNFFPKETYKNADNISEHGLYLPSGPNITNKEIQYVCKTIKELL